jgi:hypothetical protein
MKTRYGERTFIPEQPVKEAVVQTIVPHKINPNKRINIASMRNK